MAKAGGKTKSTPKKTTTPPKNASADNMVPDAGSVDKIRDILFGNQMRDFERRFSLMEERMNQTTQNLRDETHQRMEALEQYFKKEMADLKERLKDESEQRTDGDKQQHHALNELSDALHKAIADVEEKFSAHATDLRQQILTQSKSLSADIQTKYDQASQALRLTSDNLNDAKIDRSLLAEFLIEMATRLSDHSAQSNPE